jgi:FMN phosphatase YigB (HAD superfamily)
MDYAVKGLGIWSTLKYAAVDWCNPLKLKEVIFGVLDKCVLDRPFENDFLPACDEKGRALPLVVCAYQAGRIKSVDAKRKAFEALELAKKEGYKVREKVGDKIIERTEKLVSDRQITLITNAFEAMFTPQTQADFTCLIPAGIRILKKLKERMSDTFLVVPLSNVDKESWRLFREKHREHFGDFKKAFISGEMGTTKPNKAIFEKVLQDLGVTKDDSVIFADDQAENCDVGRELGFDVIHVTSAEQFEDELIKREIL